MTNMLYHAHRRAIIKTGSMQFQPLLKAKEKPVNAMMIGQCLPHDIKKEIKIQVKIQEFDSHLNMVSSY